MTCSFVKSDALRTFVRLVLGLAFISSCGAADGGFQAREDVAGDVGVAPSVNTCPTFAFYFVLPQKIRPEEAAALLVQGTDLDSDDEDLTYQWSATSGVFSTPTHQSTEYRCSSAAGPQSLSVTTSDPEGCAGSLFLDVDCTEQ